VLLLAEILFSLAVSFQSRFFFVIFFFYLACPCLFIQEIYLSFVVMFIFYLPGLVLLIYLF
jgi:hypothetical protein